MKWFTQGCCFLHQFPLLESRDDDDIEHCKACCDLQMKSTVYKFGILCGRCSDTVVMGSIYITLNQNSFKWLIHTYWIKKKNHSIVAVFSVATWENWVSGFVFVVHSFPFLNCTDTNMSCRKRSLPFFSQMGDSFEGKSEFSEQMTWGFHLLLFPFLEMSSDIAWSLFP